MRELVRFAGDHYGCFAMVHARRFGLTLRQVEHLVVRGEAVRVHDDVFRFTAAPVSWRGELLAACWAGGFRAVASHRSAAALWGLAGGRRHVVEITCPRWRRARHSGLIVHESNALDPVDVTILDGIPVTSPERTLLGLAAVAGASSTEMALDRAESRDLVTLVSVGEMLTRLATRGRPGAALLRGLLAARAPSRAPTASEMETLLIQTLRANGYPEPVTQFEVPGTTFRVDAAYPRWRVVIEYDSYQEHAGRLALARDHRRRLAIQAAGYEVLSVSMPELRAGARTLCAAIAIRRTGVVPAS